MTFLTVSSTTPARRGSIAGGTGPDDRGIHFYFEWVRDHVGRYAYPRHIKLSP